MVKVAGLLSNIRLTMELALMLSMYIIYGVVKACCVSSVFVFINSIYHVGDRKIWKEIHILPTLEADERLIS